jgi:hypothetical protein
MTDDELRELVVHLAQSQIKTDAPLAQTDAQLDKLAEMYGDEDNNPNKVAEEFYYNSFKNHLVLNGIHFDFIDKNVTRS